MARLITFLNRSGDQTIGWTPDRDDAMREYIQRHLDEGYVFFVLKPVEGEMLQVRLKDFDQAVQSGRKIVLTNTDADALITDFIKFVEGAPEVTEDRTTGQMARTPDEVINNHTAAVRPAQGG